MSKQGGLLDDEALARQQSYTEAKARAHGIVSGNADAQRQASLATLPRATQVRLAEYLGKIDSAKVKYAYALALLDYMLSLRDDIPERPAVKDGVVTADALDGCEIVLTRIFADMSQQAVKADKGPESAGRPIDSGPAISRAQRRARADSGHAESGTSAENSILVAAPKRRSKKGESVQLSLFEGDQDAR